MASFLEYILDSIYVFKVVDFKFLGLHRLVWFLLREIMEHVIVYSVLTGLPMPVI